MAVAVALLVPGAISVGTAVFNGQFAASEIASCTMQQGRQITYKRSGLRARIATDCGNFRGAKEVSCTSDASQQIALIAGTTYDLTVRGPRIPLISAPTIVSATVSDEQLADPEPGLTEIDPDANDNVQSLQSSLLPETLRAFDYEQPDFDPSCDPFRSVMTTNGIQSVSPARAEELLEVPDGITPSDPLLPCEGYQCSSADVG